MTGAGATTSGFGWRSGDHGTWCAAPEKISASAESSSHEIVYRRASAAARAHVPAEAGRRKSSPACRCPRCCWRRKRRVRHRGRRGLRPLPAHAGLHGPSTSETRCWHRAAGRAGRSARRSAADRAALCRAGFAARGRLGLRQPARFFAARRGRFGRRRWVDRGFRCVGCCRRRRRVVPAVESSPSRPSHSRVPLPRTIGAIIRCNWSTSPASRKSLAVRSPRRSARPGPRRPRSPRRARP